MRVSRDELLQSLEAVAPGLAKKDSVEQSSCFVFYADGRVATFNDEIACYHQTPLRNISGAVAADPLRQLLQKLKEEFLELNVVEHELQVMGQSRRSGIIFQATVALPLDRVEEPASDSWVEIKPELGDAMALAGRCASKDGEGSFYLTCIHFHPKFVEACDNLQIIRYMVETGAKTTFLLKAESVNDIAALGMTEFSETQNWAHFRNAAGLMVACRKYVDDFPDISTFLSMDGASPLVLPPGIAESAGNCSIFTNQNSDNNRIVLHLKSNACLIEGRGGTGWHQEKIPVQYNGPEIKFAISPKILSDLVARSTGCMLCPGRLIVDGGTYRYASCLGTV